VSARVEAAAALIKEFEGCCLTAYRCPAGKLSIGYGCTRGVREGMTITREQAHEMLLVEIHRVEGLLSQLITAPVTENEFAAMISFAYNIGVTAFRKSTLLKLLNSGTVKSVIADEFLRWCHIRGVMSPGLKRRRQGERCVFKSMLVSEFRAGSRAASTLC
jgi:lysozyme